MDKEKNIEQKEKELFSNLKIEYSKSKEEVWKSMEALIDQDAGDAAATEETPALSRPLGRIIPMNRFRVNIAAAVVLLAILTLSTRFYTVSHEAANVSLASYELPDGSSVQLNAQSAISYAPYWWRFKRQVELDGEAFFQVEKGKAFTVNSEQGSTQVLGTSFNIYARDKKYEVYCVTGKVKVTDARGEEVILYPGEFAGLSDAAPLQKNSDTMEETILSWRAGNFIYNTTPLSKVFKDVERHYNISLDLAIDGIDTLIYTGNFERSETPAKALEIICYSFGLEFEKTDGNRYSVSAN